MDNAPQFFTAIPKRRYRIGEFEAVILGDIESRDDTNYVYVCALVREGENAPCVCVSLVNDGLNALHMRVQADQQSRSFHASGHLADIKFFAEAAIDAAVRLFNLRDEEPYRLA